MGGILLVEWAVYMKDTIKAFLKGDVDDSAEALRSHSRDASLFEITPELVVYPKDADDVSALVRYVAEQKKINPALSITPRSAGTCMAGGSLTNSISLDGMRYLTRLSEASRVTPYEYLPNFFGAEPVTIAGEIKAQPGVYYRNLEPVTLNDNLLLPCFTGSKDINAIGGMIGNNSGGELSLKYGKMQDYVKSVEVVLADGSKETFGPVTRVEAEAKAQENTFAGSIYRGMLALLDKNKDFIESKRPRVSKNSAGYNLWNILRKDAATGEEIVDLSQLITGSEGTLAVTTDATLRLVEKKRHSMLLVLFLSDLGELPDIVVESLKTKPETIEAYDDKTIMLAVRFWRGFIKKMGLFGAVKFGLEFVPEFKMMLGGMPKLVLLVECAGDDKVEVLSRVENLKKKLSGFKKLKMRVVDRAAAEKYWTIRRKSFSLLREHFNNKRTAPFVDDVCVPPAKLPEFFPAVQAILEKYNLTYNIHGHAGNGNFHLIPLIDMDARLSKQMILDVSEEVYSLVIKMGGTITAEHNDGIIRTPYLADMFGAQMIALFADVKKIFDPENIFNPGKKVGLTKADIEKYLISGQ
jgi:FAD/FMN-containing dehydrogenase